MATVRRALLLLLAACGCGTPIAGNDFRGSPKYAIRVQGTWAGSGEAPDGGFMVSLFMQPTRESVDPNEWTELVSSATPLPTVPANFTVNLYAMPGPDQSVRGAPYAIGRVVAYQDANANGRFDPGEPVEGIEPPFVWLFAPQDLEASASPTGTALKGGIYHLNLPQRCAPPPGPTTPGTCGVPLGARCSIDADCGGGVCLKETKFPWPAGYCAIAEPVADGGCRPGDASFTGVPRFSPTPDAYTGLWLRACQTDADCARANDRDQGLYACDLGLRACMPAAGGAPLPIGDRQEVEPFCAGPRAPPPPQ